MRTSFLSIIVILLLCFSCKQRAERERPLTVQEKKKMLQEVNKALVNKDKELIEAYIKENNLSGMKDNGSGLYAMIWGDSLGVKPVEGSLVLLDYTVTLLDGTVCYTSENKKPKEFKVGFGGAEAGLDMAVRMMSEGQKGKFILPPHLAHGLLGDNNKIPPRSIIVYDVHLLNVIGK